MTVTPPREPPARRAVLATVSVVALAPPPPRRRPASPRGGDGDRHRRLRMMIPNSPGGGYDLTGRAAAKVMEDEDITGRFEVSNVAGASGTVAMQRLLNEKGADDLLMTMGLGVVGAVYTNKSDATVAKAARSPA